MSTKIIKHDLIQNSEDVPNNIRDVLAQLDNGMYDIAWYVGEEKKWYHYRKMFKIVNWQELPQDKPEMKAP